VTVFLTVFPAQKSQKSIAESSFIDTSRSLFLGVFAQALLELLEQEVLRIELVHGAFQTLGRPIQVLNKRIDCFESDACKIAVPPGIARNIP
jgi:hypothetical protein